MINYPAYPQQKTHQLPSGYPRGGRACSDKFAQRCSYVPYMAVASRRASCLFGPLLFFEAETKGNQKEAPRCCFPLRAADAMM